MPGPGSGSPLGRAPPHTWRQISSAGRGRDSALGSLGALWPSLERCWWCSVLTVFTFYLWLNTGTPVTAAINSSMARSVSPPPPQSAAITDLIITISLTNGGCSLAKPDRDKLVPSSTETPSIRQRRGEKCRWQRSGGLFWRAGAEWWPSCFCSGRVSDPSINFISLLNRHYVKMRQDGPGIFKFCQSKVSPSALLLPIARFNGNLSNKLLETPIHIKLVATL